MIFGATRLIFSQSGLASSVGAENETSGSNQQNKDAQEELYGRLQGQLDSSLKVKTSHSEKQWWYLTCLLSALRANIASTDLSFQDC